jgi:HEAT repeat protein
MVMAIAAIADTFQSGSLREHFIPSVIDEPLRLMLAFLMVASTAASLVILVASLCFALAQIRFALSSSNSEVRAAAAFAAGRLKFAAAVNPLTAALRDFEPAVASAAGQALARLGPAGRAALRSAIERGGDSADASIEALESLAFESATFKDLASPL